jgi:hypothetical protein
MPRDITLTVGGILGIVVVVALAILVRPVPFGDQDAVATNERPSSGSTKTAAAPTTEKGSEPRSAPESVAVPSGSSRELRARLAKAVRGNKTKEAVDTLEALLAADPRSGEDVDVREDIIELAASVAYQGGTEADRVFDALSLKAGTTGPDVLYAIATSKGGSKAANRAVAALKDEATRKKASPATKIAFDMWNTKSCPDKAALLDRARDDGDGRTLGWLQVMGRACQMSKDPKLEEAANAIRSRMR